MLITIKQIVIRMLTIKNKIEYNFKAFIKSILTDLDSFALICSY